MAYVNDKPVLLVCDDMVFIKKLPEVAGLLPDASCGFPYDGAKEHYILDVEDRALVEQVLPVLEQVIPVPKKRKKK